MKKIKYYYFGPQCYGYKYMGLGAKGLAKRLGYEYQEIDMTNNDNIPNDLYLPGNIVVDDFTIVYPGSIDQLEQVYKTKKPIKGGSPYIKKEVAKTACIKPINENIEDGSSICLPEKVDSCEKLSWYKNFAKNTFNNFGYIAYHNEKAVAALEFLRQDFIPYKCVKKNKDALFITCVYNNPAIDKDYRYLLIAKLKQFAKEKGFSKISVISGLKEPYPNGPNHLFEDLGFKEVKQVGSHLLKYDTDKAFLMEYYI